MAVLAPQQRYKSVTRECDIWHIGSNVKGSEGLFRSQRFPIQVPMAPIQVLEEKGLEKEGDGEGKGLEKERLLILARVQI